MKSFLLTAAAATQPILCCARAVHTRTLELRCGNHAPGSRSAPRFSAQITDANGHHLPIDTQPALRASPNLDRCG